MIKNIARPSKGMLITYAALVLLLAALITLGCLRSNVLLSKKSTITADYSYGEPAAPMAPLAGGGEIRQEIRVNGELKDVSVMLATHGRKNTGRVTVSLWDGEIELVSKTTSQSLVRDKAMVKLILPEPHVLDGTSPLMLKIATEGSGENDSISAWRTENGSGYPSGTLYVNGTPYDADLCFAYTLVKRNYTEGVEFWLWSLGALALLSFTYWLCWGKRFYAWLAGIFASFWHAPLKWGKGLLTLFAAAALGFLTEYAYGHLVTGGPTSAGGMINPPRLAFFIAAWMLLAVFFLLRHQAQAKPEKLFVALMLILGCLFIFALPDANFVSWDGSLHFYWSLSQSFPGEVYTTWTDATLWQDILPLTFRLEDMQAGTADLDVLYDEGYIGATPNAGIDRFITLIGHWPAGLGMALGRALGLPFQGISMFGKLGNLLAYTFIIYFAMRKLRSGKMLMGAIAAMPTPFLLATNYSYDFWITAWVMLAFATYFSELAQPERKMSFGSAVTMLGAMLIACLPKQPYVPLLLPFLFMKRQKFAGRKQQAAYILSVIGVGLIIAATLLIVRMESMGDGDMRGGDTVSMSGQIQYILSNPAGFFKTMFGFLKEYLSFGSMGDTLTFFAYLGTNSSASYAACLLLLIAVTDTSGRSLHTQNARTRALVWPGVLLTVFALAASMYIAFTPVGFHTVNGCQPRYLLPLMFPVLFLISSAKIENKMSPRLYYYMGHGVMAFILLQAIWDRVVSQYY